MKSEANVRKKNSTFSFSSLFKMSGHNFVFILLLSSILFFRHLNAFEICKTCRQQHLEENNLTSSENENFLSQWKKNLDGRALVNWETEEDDRLLSRHRRNFGGKEPIDYAKAFNAVFTTTGWLTQGLEAFSDINFHLLGYTALGKILNSQLKGLCQVKLD